MFASIALPFIGIGTQGKRGPKFVYVDYEPPEDMPPIRRHAGYREIRAWILQEYGFGVSPYQVAYVKRKNGAVAPKSRNGPPEPTKTQSVPPEKEAAIEAALEQSIAPELLPILKQLAHAQTMLNGITAEAYYVDGFKTGARFMLAVQDDACENLKPVGK